MLFLLAPQSKIQDIQERQQRNHKPNRHVIGPDISHQHWGKGSACYSHNDIDRKSTRLNSSHIPLSRMPSSA